MIIRRLNQDEADLVTEIFNDYRIFYKQPSDPLLARKYISDRLKNDESIIFAAFANGGETPVGFTQLFPRYSSLRASKNWLLNDLYVNEHYRKQGIGKALIETAIKFAQDHYAKFIELSTAVDNFTAQSLYEDIGFKKKVPDNQFFTYTLDLL